MNTPFNCVKIFFLYSYFACVFLLSAGCKKREETFINRWYTYEDVQRYVQIGTSKEVVLARFGKPGWENVFSEGEVYWAYSIEHELVPKQAETAGFTLVLREEKVIRMDPILRTPAFKDINDQNVPPKTVSIPANVPAAAAKRVVLREVITPYDVEGLNPGKDGLEITEEIEKRLGAEVIDLTGIRSVRAESSEHGVFILFEMTDEGSKRFEAATARNIGEQIAIIIDGKIISAPVVHMAIPGPNFQISGHFTRKETDALVEELNQIIRAF